LSKLITIQNQSLLDIAIEKYGEVSGIFDLALKNEISITSENLPGTIIEVPVNFRLNEVTNYFYKNSIAIATNEKQTNFLFETGLFETGLFE